MEVLISASQEIIEMVQNRVLNISEGMSEKEYLQWIQTYRGDERGDEDRLQEVSI